MKEALDFLHSRNVNVVFFLRGPWFLLTVIGWVAAGIMASTHIMGPSSIISMFAGFFIGMLFTGKVIMLHFLENKYDATKSYVAPDTK